MPRPRLMVGLGSTTLIVVTKGLVMLFRGNDSVSLAKTTSSNSLTTQTSPRGPQQRARSTRAARLASPLSSTRSACGWLARPSTCPSTTDWCRSIIEVCLSPFTPNGTARSKNPRRWLEERNGSVAYGTASHSGSDRHPQGRLVRQRLLRGHQLPGRQQTPPPPCPCRDRG